MTSNRDKTLSYHRAEFFDDTDSSINLAMCLALATDKLRKVADREVARGNGQIIRLAAYKRDDDGGHYAHLTVDTPGESASIVPKASSGDTEIEVGTTSPPSNAEFMDGDAFFYLRRNDLCLCTTTIRIGAARYFLQEFFSKAKIRKDALQFDLLNIANIEKIALMEAEGVKKIQLRASLYRASFEYQRRISKAGGVMSVISKYMKAIFANESDVNEDALQVELTISADRRKKGLDLGYERLQKIGKDIIENEEHADEYVIWTKDNKRIEARQIFMRSNSEIEAKGKSVDRDDAWLKLASYFKYLRGEGIMEQ